MKTDKYIVSVAIFALMFAAGVTVASAYQGDYTEQGPYCDEDQHEAIEEALENLDYDTWSYLMDGRGRVTQVINEDNFEQFVEAHELAEDGDYEEADEILQELGLRGGSGEPVGTGYRSGNGQGNGVGRGQGNGYGRGLSN